MSDNILEIKGLVKKYDSFTLGPVDLSIPRGSIMGFIGENGAGKSTTIKLIIGALRRNEGTIKLFGKETNGDDAALKQRIGVVLDGDGFDPSLTPVKINSILGSIYKKWSNDRFFELLRTFDIAKDKKVGELSRGMGMKLSLATALSHDAELLILDEPTSGLDPIVRDELLDIFLDFVRDENHSIFISSHITGDLEKAADYITFIHKGQIMLTDEKDALLDRLCVLKCANDDIGGLDSGAILGIRRGTYGAQVLIDRSAVPSGGIVDKATLEDIMLYTIRGEKQ